MEKDSERKCLLNPDESIDGLWTERVLADGNKGGKKWCPWQRKVRVFGRLGKRPLGLTWPEHAALGLSIHSMRWRLSYFHYSFAHSVTKQIAVVSLVLVEPPP